MHLARGHSRRGLCAERFAMWTRWKHYITLCQGLRGIERSSRRAQILPSCGLGKQGRPEGGAAHGCVN